MSNFALTSLALSSVCPTNKVIVDDKGDPSVMVERPAQMLNALLTNGDSTAHPAFLVNGVQRKKLVEINIRKKLRGQIADGHTPVK